MQHRSGSAHNVVVHNRLSAAFAWLVGALLALSPLNSHAGVESHSGTKGSIVAAGFGYQSGSDSVITVKVYDAQSGKILSDDVFQRFKSLIIASLPDEF